MIRNLIFILASIFFSGQGFAQSSPFLNPPSSFSPKLQIESLINKNPVSPGESFRIYLSVQIEEGWHVYALKPLPGNELLATQIVLEDHAFEEVTVWQESPVSLIQDDALEKMVKGHTLTAEFYTNLNVPTEFRSGRYTLNGHLLFKACDNKLCTLPQELPFASSVSVSKTD